jgi:hypothetical protein
MMQTQLRRLIRVEQSVQAYLNRKEREHAEQMKEMKERAFTPLANLALLILYGSPDSEETLEAAWERCRQSPTWKALCQRHSDFGPYRDDDWVSPFGHTACHIAEYFRKYMLPDFAGADANAKLEAILEAAPAWLLWCSHADVHARFLGITLPDLSSVDRFARGDFSPYLRTGPFECRRLPKCV